MIAKNIKELEKMLNNQMRKAMQQVQQKAEADLYESVGKYYTSGEPKVYQRTGALMNTPNVTPLSVSSNNISFEAYLDDNYTYKTGAKPTMNDVLHLTNERQTASSVGTLRPGVGKQGYWEEAKQNIEKDLNETMSKFFN